LLAGRFLAALSVAGGERLLAVLAGCSGVGRPVAVAEKLAERIAVLPEKPQGRKPK